MGAFWESWQLWEKMCFVLGVAIILTVMAACGKLIHNHYRLRKFTRVAAEQALEEGTQQMRQKTARRGRVDNEVPFGIRAIESGIEVDGVWISRNNSPAASSPGSPASHSTIHSAESLAKEKAAKQTSSIPSLAMPKPAYPDSKPTVGGPLGNSQSKSLDSKFDRAVAAEKDLGRNAPPADSRRRSRQPYKPRLSSHLRYSSADIPAEEVSSGDDGYPRSSTSHRCDRSPSGSSAESGDSSDNGRAPKISETKRHSVYTNYSALDADKNSSSVTDMPFNAYTGVDLDSLASHRRSQAAEIGQLLSRSRQSSGDWTPSVKSGHSYAPITYDSSLIETPTASETNSFQTPAQASKVEIATEAPSLKTFMEVASNKPGRQSVTPMDNADLSQPVNDQTSPCDWEANKSQNKTQVLRKVNSGFEILNPGTLDASRKSWSGGERVAQGPGERKQPNKLHKKNNSVTTPSRNSFSVTERV